MEDTVKEEETSEVAGGPFDGIHSPEARTDSSEISPQSGDPHLGTSTLSGMTFPDSITEFKLDTSPNEAQQKASSTSTSACQPGSSTISSGAFSKSETEVVKSSPQETSDRPINKKYVSVYYRKYLSPTLSSEEQPSTSSFQYLPKKKTELVVRDSHLAVKQPQLFMIDTASQSCSDDTSDFGSVMIGDPFNENTPVVAVSPPVSNPESTPVITLVVPPAPGPSPEASSPIDYFHPQIAQPVNEPSRIRRFFIRVFSFLFWSLNSIRWASPKMAAIYGFLVGMFVMYFIFLILFTVVKVEPVPPKLQT